MKSLFEKAEKTDFPDFTEMWILNTTIIILLLFLTVSILYIIILFILDTYRNKEK